MKEMKTLTVAGETFKVVDSDSVRMTPQTLTDAQKAQVRYNIGAAPSDKDYIVEEGVTGGWLYRKWHSGLAECWKSVTSSVPTTAWKDSGMMSFLSYGLYWTSAINSQGYIELDYPFDFAVAPIEIATLSNSTKWFPLSLISTTTDRHTSKTDCYRICSYKVPDTALDITINFHVVGAWK